MKHFTMSLGRFFILPLTIFILFELFLRSQNSLYKEKFEGALLKKDSIELIALGNSHATYGVNPKAFDIYAFNLANVSQSIYFDKRITLKLLDDLKLLKYVLISIDYHSLYFSSQDVRNIWSYYYHRIGFKQQDYTLANVSYFFWGYSPKVSIAILKRRVENKIKYGDNSIDFLAEKGVNPSCKIYRGFIGFQGTNYQVLKPYFMKHRANGFNKMAIRSKEKGEILDDLKNFLITLQKRGITPILYTCPTYKEYNTYLKDNVLKSNIEEIDELCKEFNLKYWNFMDADFSAEDFYNADHLNTKGALKFSFMLNDSINSL